MFSLDLSGISDRLRGVTGQATNIVEDISGLSESAHTVWSTWSSVTEGNQPAAAIQNNPVRQDVLPIGTNVTNNEAPSVTGVFDTKTLMYAGLGLAVGVVALVALRK